MILLLYPSVFAITRGNMPACFAIGFRPSYIFLLPILSLVTSFSRPHFSRARIFLVLLHVVYPVFNMHRCVESYRCISNNYEIDKSNLAYLASPLQGLYWMLSKALSSQSADVLLSA